MDLDDFREGIRLRYMQDDRVRDKITTVTKLSRALDESRDEANKLRVVITGKDETMEIMRNTIISLINRNGDLQERWQKNKPIKWFLYGLGAGAVGTGYLFLRHGE